MPTVLRAWIHPSRTYRVRRRSRGYFRQTKPFRAHHPSRGIVRDFDQPQRLLLLSRLRHRAMRTADVAPPPTDFRHYVRFRIDVTLAESAFRLRAAVHHEVAPGKQPSDRDQ